MFLGNSMGQPGPAVDRSRAAATRSGILLGMEPRPLPIALGSRPFTVREGLDAGTTRMRLRASDLDRSTWGVRVTTPPQTVAERCAVLAARLPDDTFFSHSTAALLLNAPLDWSLERDPDLHASIAVPRRAPHARGIRGHRLAIAPGDVVATRGIRHTSAARTWLDLAPMLDLGNLVAVGDFLIHWRLPLTTHAELAARVAQWTGRGIVRLRQAVELLSDHAESRPESRLRVILAIAGLPTPEVNYVVVDTDAGKRVRVDLVFAAERVVLEYQGDYHRTREQWRKDMTRRSRLEVRRWFVMELNADDLVDPGELVERIQMAFSRPR